VRGGWDCSYWPSSCSLSRWSCFPLAVCAALSPLAANETSSSSALLPPSRKDAPLPQVRKANETTARAKTRTRKGKKRRQRQRRKKRKEKAKRKCRTEKVTIGIEGLRVFRFGHRMWGSCPLSPPSTTYRVRCRGCHYCWRRYEVAPMM